MRSSIFPKLGGCVLCLLVPFGTAQGWDGSDIQEVSYLEDNATTAPGAIHAFSENRGAQGPIRTEFSENQPAGKKGGAKKQDPKFKNYPYPDEDKNFRYPEGG